MIKTTLYSQRDTRWSAMYLGFSKLRIGSFGCTITSIANMLSAFGYNETPATVNTKLKAVGGFSGALVIWTAVSKVWPKAQFVKRALNFNNVEVAWYVYGKQIPVIVKVHAPQIGALNHWVLYVGDRKMVDPWTGKIVPTSTYGAEAYALYNKA